MGYFADEYDEDYVGYCDWCGEEVGNDHYARQHNFHLSCYPSECPLCAYCPWGNDDDDDDEQN